jgi:hypothetical protein
MSNASGRYRLFWADLLSVRERGDAPDVVVNVVWRASASRREEG